MILWPSQKLAVSHCSGLRLTAARGSSVVVPTRVPEALGEGLYHCAPFVSQGPTVDAEFLFVDLRDIHIYGSILLM